MKARELTEEALNSGYGFKFQYSIPYIPEEIAREFGAALYEKDNQGNEIFKGVDYAEIDYNSNKLKYKMTGYLSPDEELKRRCVAMEFKDGEIMDSLILKFRNDDLFLFSSGRYTTFFQHGTLIKFRFGYSTIFSSWKYMKVLFIEGLQEVVVHAYELAPTRFIKASFGDTDFGENNSLKELVYQVGIQFYHREIKAQNFSRAHPGSHIHVEELRDPNGETVRPVNYHVDASKTILCFLQDLADRYGYHTWFQDESVGEEPDYHLYFKPRDFLQGSTWKFSYFADPSEQEKRLSNFYKISTQYHEGKESKISKPSVFFGGPIISMEDPQTDARDKLIYTEASEIDPATGQVKTVKFRYFDSRLDEETGEKVLSKRSIADIHGYGFQGSLANTWVDLHSIYTDYDTKEQTVDEKETNKNQKFVEMLSKAINEMHTSNRVPTREWFETVLNAEYKDTVGIDITTYVNDESVFGASLDESGIYENVFLEFESKRDQLNDELADELSQEVVERAKSQLERAMTIVTNNGSELYGRLFGKIFREAAGVMDSTIRVIGNPDIRARQVSEIAGTYAYDTKWYHLEVRHTIDNNGFLSEIAAISNAAVFDNGKIVGKWHPAPVKETADVIQEVSDRLTELQNILFVGLVNDVKVMMDLFSRLGEFNKAGVTSAIGVFDESKAGFEEIRADVSGRIQEIREAFDITVAEYADLISEYSLGPYLIGGATTGIFNEAGGTKPFVTYNMDTEIDGGTYNFGELHDILTGGERSFKNKFKYLPKTEKQKGEADQRNAGLGTGSSTGSTGVRGFEQASFIKEAKRIWEKYLGAANRVTRGGDVIIDDPCGELNTIKNDHIKEFRNLATGLDGSEKVIQSDGSQVSASLIIEGTRNSYVERVLADAPIDCGGGNSSSESRSYASPRITSSGGNETMNFILVKEGSEYDLYKFPDGERASKHLDKSGGNCFYVTSFINKESAQRFIADYNLKGGHTHAYINDIKCAELVGRNGADTEFELR